jgi:hypothetical protein
MCMLEPDEASEERRTGDRKRAGQMCAGGGIVGGHIHRCVLGGIGILGGQMCVGGGIGGGGKVEARIGAQHTKACHAWL